MRERDAPTLAVVGGLVHLIVHRKVRLPVEAGRLHAQLQARHHGGQRLEEVHEQRVDGLAGMVPRDQVDLQPQRRHGERPQRRGVVGQPP